MKNRNLKIIISMLLMLIMIILSSTVDAIFMKDTNGDGEGDADWHYAAGEIKWNKSKQQIEIIDSEGKSHYYYCANHHNALTKGMANTTKLSLTSSVEWKTTKNFMGWRK